MQAGGQRGCQEATHSLCLTCISLRPFSHHTPVGVSLTRILIHSSPSRLGDHRPVLHSPDPAGLPVWMPPADSTPGAPRAPLALSAHGQVSALCSTHSTPRGHVVEREARACCSCPYTCVRTCLHIMLTRANVATCFHVTQVGRVFPHELSQLTDCLLCPKCHAQHQDARLHRYLSLSSQWFVGNLTVARTTHMLTF